MKGNVMDLSCLALPCIALPCLAFTSFVLSSMPSDSDEDYSNDDGEIKKRKNAKAIYSTASDSEVENSPDDEEASSALDYNSNAQERTAAEITKLKSNHLTKAEILDQEKDNQIIDEVNDRETIAAATLQAQQGISAEEEGKDKPSSEPKVILSQNSKSINNAEDEERRQRLFKILDAAEDKLEPFHIRDNERISNSYKAADFDQDEAEGLDEITQFNTSAANNIINKPTHKRPAAEEPFDLASAYSALLSYMKANETLNQTIQRFGQIIQNSKQKHQNKPKQKNIRKNAQSSNSENLTKNDRNEGNDEIEAAELAVSTLSSLANNFVWQADIPDIYHKSYQQLERALAQLNSSSNDEVEWLYKLSLDNPTVFGPFNSREMLSWQEAGYFHDSNIVCRAVGDTQWLQPKAAAFSAPPIHHQAANLSKKFKL
jgi:hypothetical protein